MGSGGNDPLILEKAEPAAVPSTSAARKGMLFEETSEPIVDLYPRCWRRELGRLGEGPERGTPRPAPGLLLIATLESVDALEASRAGVAHAGGLADEGAADVAGAGGDEVAEGVAVAAGGVVVGLVEAALEVGGGLGG